MKTIKITLLTLGLIVFSAAGSFAQIKIGLNPTTINTSSILEIESTTKGVLLPRIPLQSTTSFAPLASHVAGMIVYNTATAGTAPTNVVPGFYYNDGTKWLSLADFSVTTAKLADAAVTTAKIAPGTANQILVTNSASPVAVEWFTPTNTLTAANGQLVSTVNGLASSPAVNVLISADNGLTVTNGNVQLGGALTAATTITTDAAKTLALTGLQDGANTDKMLVVDANGVIKTTSGRNVIEIVNKTAAYTVVDTDHTILANLTAGAFTITLPTASATNKGRVLVIRKTDETNNVLTFSESIKFSESTSFTTLNYLSTIRIQSDGTSWYKID